MTNKHIELARKIKALSDKGVGGEKANAEKMLLDLMKKHNLKIEDIEGEDKKDYFFKVDDEYNSLFFQIVKSVNRDINVYRFPKNIVRQHRLKGNHEIKCTVAEYIEIEQSFDIYTKLYKEELKTFYEAFIHANNIYPKSTEEEKKSINDLSADEKSQWIKKVLMAQNIKKANIHKQLNK